MIHRGLWAGVPQLRCDVNEIAATRQERGSVAVPRIVKDVAGYPRFLLPTIFDFGWRTGCQANADAHARPAGRVTSCLLFFAQVARETF